MANESRKLLSPADFTVCAIWKYEEETDLYYPILSGDQLPESARDLRMRADFRTPFGIPLNGYVIGISSVFSIGLFGNGNIYYANKNLPDLSKKQMQAFLLTQPHLAGTAVEDLFPLEYITTIHDKQFRDFGGRFDLPRSLA